MVDVLEHMYRLLQKQLIRPRRALSKSTDQDPVRVEVRGRVMLILLNRASKRNAIDPQMSEQLYSTMRAFENMNPTVVSAAVLCSTSDNFCSGFDLHHLADVGQGQGYKNSFEGAVKRRLKYKYGFIRLSSKSRQI